MSRERVLCLVRFYLPGYKGGGPIRSIANMVDQLGDDLEFRIVTSDRDHADERPYPGVRVDDWNVVGKAQVFYMSPGYRSVNHLIRLINEVQHDVLYLNSFFDPFFSISPLFARRLNLTPRRATIIAPRGEFSNGALVLKAWKKKWYMSLARASGLCRDLTWQASSDYETQDIALALGSAARRIAVAPNLPPLTAPLVRHDKARSPDAPLRVCFLSRISPKKNLDFALRVLSRVRQHVSFDIYGPIEDVDYWKRCEALIGAVRQPVSVRYRGSVAHDSVTEVLSDYDLFFFPTHGENFGHVILESMLAGTPVLISDTTPWRHLQSRGVGWDLPLANEQAFVDAITASMRKSADDYQAWRKRTAAYARECLQDSAVVAASKRLLCGLARDSHTSHALAAWNPSDGM